MFKIIDNIMIFARLNEQRLDRALNRMVVDIERLSKAQVPHRKGQLESSGYHRKTGRLSYRVGYDKEYARFQEFGGDGKRKVKNYTKPGSKAFFLRDPGQFVAGRFKDYIKNEILK